MSLISKVGLLTRGRQFMVLQKNSPKNGVLISLAARNTRQIYEPLVQLRLYSSENENRHSDDIERIYNGVLHKKIRLVKLFSLATSAGSILCQPYLISKALETSPSTVTIGAIVTTFGFFAFATPVMLHMITKRYVVSVDYNHDKDTYIAATYSIFANKKQVEFIPDDVTLPNMSEMLTSCMIKGRPMFMDAKAFTDINHYKRIMGFDKPMDFGLDTETLKARKEP